MGDQGILSPPNYIITVIMRNSRGKLFVYVAALGVICFVIFFLSSTHSSLRELEGVNEKCQQQRDSLSAQLQVVYEHKNRLEKSLQQEKTDFKRNKEENEKHAHEFENKLQQEKDAKQQLENQISQLKTSYSELEEEKLQIENALKEQLKSVQTQKNKEIEKLQTQIEDLLAEKDKLEMSKNTLTWKIEQHTSDVKLCQLQQQQTKAELVTCQEQLQKHLQNAIDMHVSSLSVTQKKAALEARNSLLLENKPKNSTANNHQFVKKESELSNKTHFNKERRDMLERPVVLHNNLGDGVLPKPLDPRPREINNQVDAGIELPEAQNEILPQDKVLENSFANPNPLKKEDNKEHSILFKPKITSKDQLYAKDNENHPQVQPPNNFDNFNEKDDHAGERGEYGNMLPQYGVPELKQQLEQPLVKELQNKHFNKRRNFIPPPRQANNDIANAQVQDMMNKSPGIIKNQDDRLSLHNLHGFGVGLDNKPNPLRNSDALLNRDEGNHIIDDKNYEEDDDDRENDDEPLNAPGAGRKDANVLPDNDFDDQDNQDNADNAREEEGVVVAPK